MAEKIGKRIRCYTDSTGRFLVNGFHTLALFAIGGATVWSAGYAFLGMMAKGHATVEDLLLLFIYLELGAMVGIYFKTSRMPVRFLIYVAITALTRMLIGHVNVDHTPSVGILYITGAVLLLTFAEFALRYGSSRYPIETGLSEMSDFTGKDRREPS